MFSLQFFAKSVDSRRELWIQYRPSDADVTQLDSWTKLSSWVELSRVGIGGVYWA